MSKAHPTVACWSHSLRGGTPASRTLVCSGELAPLDVDSETPYLIAYTSGTTGKPKGALHVQGGFLLSIARETAYQADLRAGDRALFCTDMGWIMGPWTVVGCGAAGATIVFAEGAPDWPPDRLWRPGEAERGALLGVSPPPTWALDPKGGPPPGPASPRPGCTTARYFPEPSSAPMCPRESRLVNFATSSAGLAFSQTTFPVAASTHTSFWPCSR